MRLRCPSCGAESARLSRSGGFLAGALSIFGIERVRCTACRRRYWSSIWLLRQIFYARCPICFGLKLTTWSERHVRTSSGQAFWLALGARRKRCASCRHNFVDFRPTRRPSGGEELETGKKRL
jgi:transposase-like protein